MVSPIRLIFSMAVLLQMLPGVMSAQERVYTVSWLGIPVVDVGVNVRENTGGMDIVYTAKTRSWFDPIYALDNRYEVHLPAGGTSPSTYRKQIVERGHQDSLAATYRLSTGEVVYSNGIVREWNEGDHNLFSALTWLERRPWRRGEKHTIPVEVEGVTWEVLVECYDVAEVDGAPPECLLLVTFVRVLRGEPVLSSTDMLTHLLPGVGNKLRLGLDSKRLQIRWVKLGRAPFVVRARLNKERS